MSLDLLHSNWNFLWHFLTISLCPIEGSSKFVQANIFIIRALALWILGEERENYVNGYFVPCRVNISFFLLAGQQTQILPLPLILGILHLSSFSLLLFMTLLDLEITILPQAPTWIALFQRRHVLLRILLTMEILHLSYFFLLLPLTHHNLEIPILPQALV